MARAAARGGTYVLVTAVLLCALTACGAEGTGGGGGGTAPEETRPCPSSSGPAADSTATPSPTGTGAPGDSQAHSAAPDRHCIIESGVPAMPEDP
ncbi:hypothetical protein [Streptomyces sp. NPDC018693]|uniref:hypothetical protein n=1 Tax=unclassified Streptomyces TaxID=2593676 RepID=UPI0037AA31DE